MNDYMYALEQLGSQETGCYPQYLWKQFAVCGTPELLERVRLGQNHLKHL